MKFKLMRPNAFVPTRATDGSAGFDLYACENVVPHRIEFGVEPVGFKIYKVPLGVAVEIPKGQVGLLVLRSSLGLQGWSVPNGVGVIDSDYRGEIHALIGTPFTGRELMCGARIAQLVVVPCEMSPVELVDELSETKRGAGGFGSTGER